MSKLDKGTCCFNHIIGLPQSEKTGKINPLYDYERIIVSNIFKLTNLPNGKEDPKNRHVWVKKATGLGITELILRLMIWLCVKDNRYRNSQMCIITGPELSIAIGLIQRMKRILENANIFIQNKETVLVLNGVEIKAFPSNHLETYRGLTSPKFIFLDEGDFFRESNIQNVRDTTERYITKSKPYIVMVSTPNKPDLLFQQIEDEPEEICMYRRLFFNYEWGLGKMFTQDEIDIQKVSPSFDREYDLKYTGAIGNVFSQHMIDDAIQLGEQYKSLEPSPYVQHFGGIDPGFSKFTPLYIAELDKEHQCVRIVWWSRLDNTTTPEAVAELAFSKFVELQHNLWWFVDGSNRGLINAMKVKFDESLRWSTPAEVSVRTHHIIPVNFGAKPSPIANKKAAIEGHEMLLEHLHDLMSRRMLAIPKECTELITSLRSAYAEEWDLDKERTVYDDDLDSIRLLLKEVKIT